MALDRKSLVEVVEALENVVRRFKRFGALLLGQKFGKMLVRDARQR